MGCTECGAGAKREGQLRSRWARVEDGGKRRVAAATTAMVGAVVGWRMGQGQGVLVGMFLAGSLGEIYGLARYGIPAVQPSDRGEVTTSVASGSERSQELIS